YKRYAEGVQKGEITKSNYGYFADGYQRGDIKLGGDVTIPEGAEFTDYFTSPFQKLYAEDDSDLEDLDVGFDNSSTSSSASASVSSEDSFHTCIG
ncbi:hypothetical protein THAOC_36943, partial [Thalassiosira oceanica]